MTDPADALRDLANALSGEEPANDAPAPKVPPRPTPGPASHRPESPIAAHPAPGSHRPESPIAAKPQPQNPIPPAEPDPAMASASALAELSGEMLSPYNPGPSSPERRHRLKKPNTSNMQLHIASVPVLVTVALVMFVLGLWGVAVKLGLGVPLADHPEAGGYSLLALVGLPLGLFLFAGAGFFVYMVMADRKKLKAYEDAMKALHEG